MWWRRRRQTVPQPIPVHRPNPWWPEAEVQRSTFILRGVAGHVTSIKVRVPFAVYIDLGEEHK